MEGLGIALAVAPMIDLCFKYGRLLKEICVTLKGAKDEINERILRVESCWKRTAIQLEFIQRVWTSLDEEHQRIQSQILQILNNKMSILVPKLQKLANGKHSDNATERPIGKLQRVNYVLVKRQLDESLAELTAWQQMFDPTWYLILRISSPFVDQELGRDGSTISSFTGVSKVRDAVRDEPLQKVRVMLPQGDLNSAQIQDVPFSSAKLMQKAGSDKWRVIDHVTCGAGIDVGSVTRDIRDFARKLDSVDSLTFGILQCLGVVRTCELNSQRPSSFDFVLRIPKGLEYKPRSLRDHLYSGQNLRLTNRFEVAKQIAKSVSYVHTLGFVHKNIRPETLLGFEQIEASGLVSFFLVGFENIRLADGRTLRAGDAAWEKDMYRHPQRQGLNPKEVYGMQHDIYSLGVCLLEVGLWQSLISFEEDFKTPLPGVALGLSFDALEFKDPDQMKEHLIGLAHSQLPYRMGERYKDIVLNCLTCLDEDNVDFGDQSEFEDVDGVLIGVKYIEKILIKLNEILV